MVKRYVQLQSSPFMTLSSASVNQGHLLFQGLNMNRTTEEPRFTTKETHLLTFQGCLSILIFLTHFFSLHMNFGNITELVQILRVTSVSKQAFRIKCSVTIEVWDWENKPPLQVASQILHLAGGGWGGGSGSQQFPCLQANTVSFTNLTDVEWSVSWKELGQSSMKPRPNYKSGNPLNDT